MNVLCDADARWVALLLDTEGTITVNSGRLHPHVSVGMASVLVLDELVRLVGVGCVKPRNYVPGHRPLYHWQLGSQRAAALLRQVEPWLLEKRRQARLCIALADRLSPKLRHGAGVPADEIEHRRSMMRAVQALNRGEGIDESLLDWLCEPYVRAACANGHPWTAEHVVSAGGRDVCRTCRNAAARSRRLARSVAT